MLHAERLLTLFSRQHALEVAEARVSLKSFTNSRCGEGEQKRVMGGIEERTEEDQEKYSENCFPRTVPCLT